MSKLILSFSQILKINDISKGHEKGHDIPERPSESHGIQQGSSKGHDLPKSHHKVNAIPKGPKACGISKGPTSIGTCHCKRGLKIGML